MWEDFYHWKLLLEKARGNVLSYQCIWPTACQSAPEKEHLKQLKIESYTVLSAIYRPGMVSLPGACSEVVFGFFVVPLDPETSELRRPWLESLAVFVVVEHSACAVEHSSSPGTGAR